MTHRVLCVDDEPECLRTLLRRMRALPAIAADGARSGAEARSLMASTRYAVIITDHRMPSESGVDLLAGVAKAYPDTVPVLVTAFADLEVALDAINRGQVFALLRKPWVDEELILTVRRACERHDMGKSLREKVAQLERANAELARRNHQLQNMRSEVDRLVDIAATDSRTGTLSHRFFSDRLEEEVARARRYDHPLSLLLVGLDGFHGVSDEYGHAAGDGVLRTTADIFRESIRLVDVLSRRATDEFALLLPDTDSGGASALGERLRERMRFTSIDPIGSGRLTLSIGAASMPEQTVSSGPELLEVAGTALHLARHAGRNRVVPSPPHD